MEIWGLRQDQTQSVRFEMFRDCHYQLALQHPVLFRLTVLGTASGHGAITKNCFKTDLDYQQRRSLHEMRMYFEDTKDDCSDLGISICLLRAMLDTCLGALGRPLVHMQAALRMVEMRGGYRALTSNIPLLMLFMTFSWRFARDDLIYSDPLYNSPSYCLTESDHHCYLRFLYDTARLSRLQKCLSCDTLPLRQTIFTQNPYIKNIFLFPEDQTHPFQWQNVDWVSHLVVLIFLNRGLLDYRYSHTLTNLFLEDFNQKAFLLESDGHHSAKILARIITMPSKYETLIPLHWDRFWFTTKMLRWVLHLKPSRQQQVMQRLYLDLTYREIQDMPNVPA